MYCLRYWSRYVRKGEVKSGGIKIGNTTLVGLLYPEGNKSEKVCTGYEVQSTKGFNLLKESECHTSVQIMLCNSFLYTNNIQKYYSVSRCVISIIIVIAPTLLTHIDSNSNLSTNLNAHNTASAQRGRLVSWCSLFWNKRIPIPLSNLQQQLQLQNIQHTTHNIDIYFNCISEWFIPFLRWFGYTRTIMADNDQYVICYRP